MPEISPAAYNVSELVVIRNVAAFYVNTLGYWMLCLVKDVLTYVRLIVIREIVLKTI